MKILIKKIQSRKRHFQLLELMVAAFILLICIAPTMRIFTNIYLSQQAVIRENQRDHLVHLVHAKFTEQLYKRTVSFEDLKKGTEITLEDDELSQLLMKHSYAFTGTFTLTHSKKKNGQEKPGQHLGKLVIKVKDISPKPLKQIKVKKIEKQDPFEIFYDYSIYIDSKPVDNENNEERSSTQNQHSSTNVPSSAQFNHAFVYLKNIKWINNPA